MLRALSALFSSLFLAACGDGSDVGADAHAAVQAGAVLIDVRSAEEFAGGHLLDALNIPHPEIVAGVAALGVDKDAPIVVYCRSGNRSGIALRSLESAGYSAVTNAGGYGALKPVWDAGG
jgi:phage shock protein E